MRADSGPQDSTGAGGSSSWDAPSHTTSRAPPSPSPPAQASASTPEPGPYEQGTPGPGYPAGQTPSYHTPAPILHGKEREYVLGVILTIVTLGIYHFYYHYKVHDELCQQLGRPNELRIWLVLYIIAAILGGSTVIGAPVALGLFVFLGIKQYQLIGEVRGLLDLAPRGDAVWFLLWGTIGWLILVGPFIAYYNMVHNYNDIWRSLRSGAVLPQGMPAPVAPYAASSSWNAAPATNDPAPRDSVPSAYELAGPATASGPHAAARSGGFSVQHRHDARSPGGPAPEGPMLDQTFRCPRCHEHVTARGPAGAVVAVTCAACGEAGTVPIGA